jgi:purine-binding chemotaxis protein CheW
VIVETEHDGKESVMGVIADSVSEVVAFAPEDIEAAPEFGTAIKVDFLRGLGKVGKGFVLILDINRVLAYDVLFAEEAIAAASAEPVAEGGEEAPAAASVE